jgi:hypothetical protein
MYLAVHSREIRARMNTQTNKQTTHSRGLADASLLRQAPHGGLLEPWLALKWLAQKSDLKLKLCC